MISFAHLSLLALGFVCAAGEQAGEEATSPATPAPEELAHRLLTDAGYVIKHGNAFYRYPFPVERRVQQVRTNPLETNEIEGAGKEEGEEEERRPLFFFTREGPEGSSPRARPPGDRPYIEIRRKREVDDADIPESSKVGKLRRKRTYCRKCGKGRGGGYYVPVTYAVYPVYPVYYGGGGGKGCNVCGGGGYPSYGGGYPGYGGGGGGSFSYSSSSAHSSSGSFGWGKK